jgi:hypothetical protein
LWFFFSPPPHPQPTQQKLILTIFRIAAPHNDILPCEPYRGKVFSLRA